VPAATAPQRSPSAPQLEDCSVVSEPMRLSEPSEDVPLDLLLAKEQETMIWLMVSKFWSQRKQNSLSWSVFLRLQSAVVVALATGRA
jgi:hypothetical protein